MVYLWTIGVMLDGFGCKHALGFIRFGFIFSNSNECFLFGLCGKLKLIIKLRTIVLFFS